MASFKRMLAFDLGASSGRAILGEFDGDRLTLSEAHRFSNDPMMVNGRFTWDILRLFHEMKLGLLAAHKAGLTPESLGIDTWGVDFGLLDKTGRMVGNPVHYRDSRTEGMMDAAYAILPKDEIFARTGLAFLPFNSLYQLLSMVKSVDPALSIADKLLFMPDLLGYFFTGEIATEYTIASTSQMINPITRTWDAPLLDKLGIPMRILTPIEQPGVVRGRLTKDIRGEIGISDIPLMAIGSHDTASAVAAVPANSEKFAYISSGTWSLLGVETDAPYLNPGVMAANYTNEGGICDKTRLLKNIMGLWILQECKREWDRRGEMISFDDLDRGAEAAAPFAAFIDVDDPCFMPPGDMPGRIAEYCVKTGQKPPETHGAVIRLVLEGLSLKYRWAVDALESDILGYTLDSLNIVGGGTKNLLLNQYAANALNKPVTAGPSEATAVGNLLTQAMGLGEIGSLSQMREVVRGSFAVKTYLPRDTAMWQDAYGRYLTWLKG